MASAGNSVIDRATVERIVRQVALEYLGRDGGGKAPELVVQASSRHMHVSREDLDVLFGPGTELTFDQATLLCAGCHGYDGRTPTQLGNSFSPNAPSLASSDVQQYSNAELFVVVNGGIRLSGMPGFGNAHSSSEIWSLVHFVRSLPSTPVRAH